MDTPRASVSKNGTGPQDETNRGMAAQDRGGVPAVRSSHRHMGEIRLGYRRCSTLGCRGRRHIVALGRTSRTYDSARAHMLGMRRCGMARCLVAQGSAGRAAFRCRFGAPASGPRTPFPRQTPLGRDPSRTPRQRERNAMATDVRGPHDMVSPRGVIRDQCAEKISPDLFGTRQACDGNVM